MSSYRFPELTPIAAAPARTVYVVASGDLRPSANVKCWPIQQQLEADVTRAVESFGWTVVRGHSVRRARRPRVHRQPAQGARRVRHAPARRAAARRRGRVAVQPPRARRPAHPRRADHGRRQLERHVPWSRRPAQPHRQPDQGRGRLLLAVERRLHRRVGARGAAHLARHRATDAPDRPRAPPARPSTPMRPRSPSAGPSPTSSGGRRRSSGCSTRGAWACTTRSSTTSC